MSQSSRNINKLIMNILHISGRREPSVSGRLRSSELVSRNRDVVGHEARAAGFRGILDNPVGNDVHAAAQTLAVNLHLLKKMVSI